MKSLNEAAEDFMAQKNIAVVGVSHTKDDAANFIYRKLKETRYTVFAVNPNAKTAEGDKCYASVKDIPDRIDGVVIVTRPGMTNQIVRDCAAFEKFQESGCTALSGIASRTKPLSSVGNMILLLSPADAP